MERCLDKTGKMLIDVEACAEINYYIEFYGTQKSLQQTVSLSEHEEVISWFFSPFCCFANVSTFGTVHIEGMMSTKLTSLLADR